MGCADAVAQNGEEFPITDGVLRILWTPGHSPDHVTYATENVILSGDVLFQGSVGRTDLPGCDHAALMRSIASALPA